MNVHAKETGDHHQRDADSAPDCQQLHDVVGAVGQNREVNVQRTGQQVAVGLDEIQRTNQVVVDVAIVGVQAVDLLRPSGAHQVIQYLAHGRCVPPELDQHAFELKDAVQHRGPGPLDDLVFKVGHHIA